MPDYIPSEPQQYPFPTSKDNPEPKLPYQDISHTLECRVIRSPETTLETWFVVMQREFYETHQITHSLDKFTGLFPIYFALPTRRVIHRPVNQSNVIVESVEYLVEVSLQEIPQPLDKITPTPPCPTLDFDYEEHSESNLESKEDTSDNSTMVVNKNPIPTWMSRGTLNLLGLMQDFPKLPERI